MTGNRTSKITGRILAAALCLMLVFAVSSCSAGKEEDKAVQVPYYIGAVLKSSGDELSAKYKKALDDTFSSLETETTRFQVDYLYSDDDQLQQEHEVNSFIAQGVDAVFVLPVSLESTPMVHDLILDSGGTYCVLLGDEPAEDALDDTYVFFFGGSDPSAEIRKAADKLVEVLIPVPEEESETADK